MKLIDVTTVGLISEHIWGLDGHISEHNRHALRQYTYYYLVELSEDEFWSLVFLQNDEVLKIAPREADRRLRAVVNRALTLNPDEQRLSNNWDIEQILIITRARIQNHRISLRPIVLRDLRDNEQMHRPASKYIQDGCHRCLGYGLAVSLGEVLFSPMHAYLATQERLVL